jgi:hypothetical protein
MSNLITGMKVSDNKNRVLRLSCLLWLACLSASFAAGSEPWQARTDITDNDTLSQIKRHPLVEGYESVVMITDRGTYIAGENLWFSMYARRSGRRVIPLSVSGYAELLNASGVPVTQCRVILDGNGAGKGLLPLPDSVSSGEYLLRGYTRAMTPYGPDHFFTRIIRVVNPYSLNTGYTMISPEDYPAGPAIDLFPEGGSLLNGEPSTIVIRTIGADRKGTAATVVLSYGDGIAIDTVYTGSNGLGSAVVPGDATGVRAVALIGSAIARRELNGYTSKGHSLRISGPTDSSIRIAVQHARGRERSSDALLCLAVINRQGVAFLRRFKPGAEDEIFDIPGTDLAKGINECLLYDHNGNLLSSRLFMHTGNSEDVNLITENGILRVSLPENTSYVTVSAAISGDGHRASYESYDLLAEWVTSSTLADPFMQPFLSGEEKISDELLVTLHDRHLSIDPGMLKQVMAEDRGLVIDCTVTSLDDRGPARNKMLFINLPGKECFLQYAVSDAQGRLTFIVPPRTGSREIVIYPQDTTANLIIRTLSPFFTGAIPLRSSSGDINLMADPTIIRMSLNSQVMRIYQLRDTDTAAVTPDTLALSHFYGKPGMRLVLADYVALPEMEEFFFELIPGWSLVRTRPGYEFRLFDPVTSAEIKVTPLMLIDGTYTSDPGTIAGLSPYITEQIDVCYGNFRLGEILLPPIVSIITKKGDSRMQSLPSQALRILYQFSNPDVRFRSFTGDASGHMPSFGNTLLWAPAISTGGSRVLSFTLPRPDYSQPVTVNLTVTGKDGSMHFYSRTIDSRSL